MALKVHKAIRYTRYGEDRVRSLCGRASGFVWNPETIEYGQNVSGDDGAVTCSFCKRLIHPKTPVEPKAP
jgi:hypothetical protein